MSDHLIKALSRYIGRKDKNAVLAKCRGKCVYYGCQQSLFFDSRNGAVYWVGEYAHLRSYSERGPLPSLGKISSAEKNSSINLVLLCPTHHALVDKKLTNGEWTEEDLCKCIHNHIDYENRLLNNPFSKNASESGFRELENFKIAYDYRHKQNPERYCSWGALKTIVYPWLMATTEAVQHMDHVDIQRMKMLLEALADFSRFLRLSGDPQKAIEVSDIGLRFIDQVYFGSESNSDDAVHIRSLLIHVRSGPETGNMEQYEYCQSVYGNNSEFTANSVLCSACVRLTKCRSQGSLEEASGLVDKAEELVQIEKMSESLKARVFIYRGKIALIRGDFSSLREKRRLAKVALDYFYQAEMIYKVEKDLYMTQIVNYLSYVAIVAMRNKYYENDEDTRHTMAKLSIAAFPFRWLCLCDLPKARAELSL